MDIDANIIIQKLSDRISQIELDKIILEIQVEKLTEEVNKFSNENKSDE